MEFNLGKSEVLHFSNLNQDRTWAAKMGEPWRALKNRNAAVQVSYSLKVTIQVDRVVKKLFGTLAFIHRGYKCRSRDIMLHLCITGRLCALLVHQL